MKLRHETERLILRPLVPDDAAALARHANHPSISEYNPLIPFPYALADAEAFVQITEKQFSAQSAFPFTLEHKGVGEIVGMMGLIRVDEPNGHGEIGYWISQDYRRQGLAREGLRGLLTFAFSTLKLYKVWAKVLSPNLASQRLLDSCGFFQEGRLRQHVLVRGERLDDVIFARLASTSDP